MGRKANNMPIRKKVKDKSNKQIRGKAGLGKRRESGREEKARARERGERYIAHAPTNAAEMGESKLGYVKLAQMQEEKASATRHEESATQEPAVKKGRWKKRKRQATEATQDDQPHASSMFASHPDLAGADCRQNTVHFSEDENDCTVDAPTSSGSIRHPPPPLAGSSVVVIGLQGAPELNGRLATCARWENQKGRWLARLQPCTTSDKTSPSPSSLPVEKLLRPDNLEVHAPRMAASLRPGMAVRLVGLQGAPQLNGSGAICKAWEEAKERWRVSLDDSSNCDGLLIKASNIESALLPGSSVRLSGLSAAAHLNGEMAVCLRWDWARGRWLVRLTGGVEKLLKLENLELYDPQESVVPWPVISQTVHFCTPNEKAELLVQFLRKIREEERRGLRQRALTLIICRGAESCHSVVQRLKQYQLPCVALELGANKASKDQLLREEFQLGNKHILVADEDAARGVDSDYMRYIVVYDFPASLQEYCEILGTLGRRMVGSSVTHIGASLAFVTEDAVGSLLVDIVGYLKRIKAWLDPKLLQHCGRATDKAASSAPQRPRKGKKSKRRQGPMEPVSQASEVHAAAAAEATAGDTLKERCGPGQ